MQLASQLRAGINNEQNTNLFSGIHYSAVSEKQIEAVLMALHSGLEFYKWF